MNKHSRWPWRVVRNSKGIVNVVSAPDRDGWFHKIALVNNKNEDNARLIAAAPELLEALRDMVPDHATLSPATLAFACTVIAKATGEACTSRVEWTDAMLAELHRLRGLGVPLYECAERIGVSYPVAVYKARELGIAGRLNQGRAPGRVAVIAAR